MPGGHKSAWEDVEVNRLTAPSRRIPSARRRRRGRAGISLLEVLISIFVLAIGLLGVAAVIPIGRFEIVETAKADRCGACGRAALRDVKVRRMLDPTRWRDINLNAVAFPTSVLPQGRSFAIDPLMIARNSGNGGIQGFPYAAGTGPVMQRVTLAPACLNNAAVQQAVFNRIFTSQDDLVIPVPEEASERPRQMFIHDSGTGAAWPYFAGDSPTPPGNPMVRQAAGNYSWLVTVTPATNEAGLLVADSHLYSISVVVFYNRDFAFPPPSVPAGERTVSVSFDGGGWGGGDVRLGSSSAADLDVKENEWLMLRGFHGGHGVFKWYRIAAVGEADPMDLTHRFATLAGPDWRIDNNSDEIPDDATAAVCTGAIGVYSQVVELDWNSLWTR